MAKNNLNKERIMKVKFKALFNGVKMPEKATDGSAAYDVCIPEDTIIVPGRQVVKLGFAMEIPEGYEALIDARSGFSSKGMEGYPIGKFVYETGFGTITCSAEGVSLKPHRFNCDVIQGKIDSDYRDGIGVIVHNKGNEKFMLKAGTRIAQMTFHKVESVQWIETDELSETDREGGFGSTGTK